MLELYNAKFEQGDVWTVNYKGKETNDETEINNHICSFFNYLYKETLSFYSNNLETYLNTISFPKLTKEKSKTLARGITEKELFIALQSMENNKSLIKYNILEWSKGISSACNRKSLSCKTTQYIAGMILRQSLAQFFNSHWQDCSTVTDMIVQLLLARFFNSNGQDFFFYAGRILQQWCSLLKNCTMYQEYDTWSNQQ